MRTLFRNTFRGLVPVVLSAVIGIGLATAPAEAAQANCYNRTGGTAGAWNTGRTITFPVGAGWCIYAPWEPSYRLVWQADGNLVAYFNISDNNPKNARWSSKTAKTGAKLAFQVDGNVVIYDRGGKAIWWTGASAHRNSGTSYRMVFTDAVPQPDLLEVNQYAPNARLWKQAV